MVYFFFPRVWQIKLIFTASLQSYFGCIFLHYALQYMENGFFMSRCIHICSKYNVPGAMHQVIFFTHYKAIHQHIVTQKNSWTHYTILQVYAEESLR